MFKLLAKASLLSVILADKDAIDRQILSLVANSSLPRSLTTGISSGSLRTLHEYGCWCYFYDDVGRGKGTPVDEIDGFCKTLNEGYQCAIIDAENQGITCLPWETSYFAGSGVGAQLRTTCFERNADDICAAYACTVEGQFADNAFSFLLATGGGINYDEFGHSNGFDPAHDAGCPVKVGAKGFSAQKECCGSYPQRFPYKTLDGERACCGGRTYNTALLNCCSNGQVKANC
jgi:hypothetical protein